MTMACPGIIRLSLLIAILALLIVPASASQPKFTAISSDGSTTLAMDENGNVWAWGRIYDQTGYRIQATPAQLPISDVMAISGGGLALKKDGTVWAWGLNNVGQLGDGTNVSKPAPAQIKGLDNVIAISSGLGNNLALKKDGTVWAWGVNDHGQLGDGTLIDRWRPVQVLGLSNVKAIYAGIFAVKEDGTVWTWGTTVPDVDASGKVIDYQTPVYNFTMNCKTTPIQVPGVISVKAIDAIPGLQVTFVKSDGTVWSWGYNIKGNLGDGSAINSDYPYILTPVRAEGLTDVKLVSVAYNGWAMALKNDGTVWVWGQNNFGQHGTGKVNNTETVPVKVPGLDKVTAIIGKSTYSVFLKEDGSIWASGDNYDGALGCGGNISPGTIFPTPIKVIGPENGNAVSSTPSISIQPSMSNNRYANSTAPANNGGGTPAQNDISLVYILFGSFAVILILVCSGYFLFVRRKI